MDKSFLKELFASQKQVVQVLDSDIKEIYTDKEILDFFQALKKHSLIANSAIACKIADYLQLLNEEKNYAQIPLVEIGNIYLEAIKVHPFDISIYRSAYYFFNNVLDDHTRAKTILNEGVFKIEEEINNLKVESREES